MRNNHMQGIRITFLCAVLKRLFVSLFVFWEYFEMRNHQLRVCELSALGVPCQTTRGLSLLSTYGHTCNGRTRRRPQRDRDASRRILATFAIRPENANSNFVSTRRDPEKKKSFPFQRAAIYDAVYVAEQKEKKKGNVETFYSRSSTRGRSLCTECPPD